MLVTIHCYGNDDEDNMEVIITPGLQANCTTTYVADPSEQRALYDRLESISNNIKINDNGVVEEQ